MAICSYLVLPVEGAAERLGDRLRALPGCEVHRARNREVFILVSETVSAEADEALRRRLRELAEIRELVLTFGEIQSNQPASNSWAGGTGVRPAPPSGASGHRLVGRPPGRMRDAP